MAIRPQAIWGGQFHIYMLCATASAGWAWTAVDAGSQAKARDIADLTRPLRACVMVTVPANALIRTLTTEHAESDRMPALLAKDDWKTWLGENCSSPDAAKARLKTVKCINWKISKEERAASKMKRAKPTVSDPTGLF